MNNLTPKTKELELFIQSLDQKPEAQYSPIDQIKLLKLVAKKN